MSSVNNSPETIAGPLYVTSTNARPKTCQDKGGKPVTGSTYIQGPVQIGVDGDYSAVDATVMIGRMNNNQAETPDRSLFVKGDVKIEGDGKTDNALLVQGDEQIVSGDLKDSNLKNCTGQGCDFTDSTINIQSWKGFDIKHPSKENHRLRYVCLEGPEGGVYFRGRVKNRTEIELPDYWKDLVDIQSITVSLTPIGAHQHVIVKRWDETKIYLQSNGGMPIDCFYHVFAERKDGEKLIVEYQGETPADYPGDASQYSIAGYDYGAKGLDRAD
jgi:hypothetical protein